MTHQGIRTLFRSASLSILMACMAMGGLTAAHAKSNENIALASLIGDQLVVVRAAMQTGSNLDSNKKNAIKLPEQGLDGEVLLTMQAVVQQQCKTCNVEFLRVKTPEAIEDGEKLLPSLLAAARNNKSDQLIVLTKYRGDARVVLNDGSSSGQGKLTGLGLYTDSRPSGTDLSGSEYRNGFVAPFAYFRVFVIEVQTGNVLVNKPIGMTKAYSANESKDLDPINALKSEEKISSVIELVKAGLSTHVNLMSTGLASKDQ